MLNIKHQKNLLWLLASLLVLLSISAPLLSGAFFAPATAGVILDTPCPQQKAAQGQVIKLCQSYSPLFFFSGTAQPLFTVESLSEKIKLLFIVGLLVMSPIYLIFKPPKLQFAH